ncbi:hypothetical protein D3C80_2197100 [compost metagenome]
MPETLKKSSYWRMRNARSAALSPFGAKQKMLISVLSTLIGRVTRIWVLNWSIRKTFG